MNFNLGVSSVSPKFYSFFFPFTGSRGGVVFVPPFVLIRSSLGKVWVVTLLKSERILVNPVPTYMCLW